MVNMSVAYVRPNRSLTTLQAELNKKWPGRQADKGFITGYKAAANFTGHNADNNGICHAYDVGTYIDGDINEPDGRALAEHLRQLGENGFGPLSWGYIIHDMGTEDEGQLPMIAGTFNGWVWQTYGGESKHSDHIHISTVDLYYGDPVQCPPSVYDSTESWGIDELDLNKPIEEIDMAAKDEILARIEQVVAWEKDRFAEVNAKIDQRINDLAGWTRDDANAVRGTVAAVSVNGQVDVNALAEKLKTELTPALVSELGKKLAS